MRILTAITLLATTRFIGLWLFGRTLRRNDDWPVPALAAAWAIGWAAGLVLVGKVLR